LAVLHRELKTCGDRHEWLVPQNAGADARQ
jgi:DUF1365 family protein